MFKVIRKLIFRIILLGSVVFLAYTVFLPIAKAVTLIPPSLEIGLKPGTEYKTAIKLFNETADTLQLYTEVAPFTAKGETGQPDFDFEAEPIGLTQWIEVENGPIVLQGGERREVPMTISPPLNADPGGHYVTLFFSSSPPEGGMVRIASKVGTLILARVDGEIKEQGTIAEFTTKDDQAVFNRLPVIFQARFHNTGNVHLKPTGRVVITNLFGGESATLDFNTGTGATLPETKRKYEVVWEKELVVENAENFWTKFWQGYSNEKNNFAFGRYTAKLDIVAGNLDQATIENNGATVSFWVFPWRMILVWAVAVILAIVLLIIMIKKYNKWIIKKSKQ